MILRLVFTLYPFSKGAKVGYHRLEQVYHRLGAVYHRHEQIYHHLGAGCHRHERVYHRLGQNHRK